MSLIIDTGKAWKQKSIKPGYGQVKKKHIQCLGNFSKEEKKDF